MERKEGKEEEADEPLTVKDGSCRGLVFSLTWPQNDTTKEVALQRTIELLRPSWVVSGHELHADGGNHLHLAVGFDSRVQIAWKKLDEIADKRGNYQTTRSVATWVAYCIKNDDYVEFGCCAKDKAKKNEGKWDAVASLVRAGGSLKSIDEKFGGFVMQNKNRITEYLAWQNTLNLEPELKWGGVGNDHGDIRVAIAELREWCVENIQEDRDFKQKQLWLHGPANVGKSRFASSLARYCRTYYLPDEDWYCGYDNDCFDLVILDEFVGGKQVHFLNLFLQGGPMPLKKKGVASSFVKRDNPAVIILSNLSPRGAFINVKDERMEALELRLKVIYIGHDFELEFITQL